MFLVFICKAVYLLFMYQSLKNITPSRAGEDWRRLNCQCRSKFALRITETLHRIDLLLMRHSETVSDRDQYWKSDEVNKAVLSSLRTVGCVQEHPAQGKVTSLDITPDHRQLLSCCRDDCLQLVDLRRRSNDRVCFR